MIDGILVVSADERELDELLDAMFGPADGGALPIGGYSPGENQREQAFELQETIQDRQVDAYASLPTVDGLIGPDDLSSEEYREYYQPESGVTYRIVYPVALYRREGGTTHRVVDVYGITHCVPCGSLHPNTVIRWKNWDSSVPVNW